ncbi:ABC transporter substrate-binding protein [Serinibacter salmoneus]|uniref:Peptide/nickel transport system substrate-binding protein n=1 Tax=Serinibacter salmoneus TaxID=556530 RepID=A0A2A9CZ28_9MICO|nr:ABC transporter substrate-binding protein [Serinibacter salmoneus]PFG19255.1 peptide/nickel transport system substrate-binding protein [Serinibacter salmoneus]
MRTHSAALTGVAVASILALTACSGGGESVDLDGTTDSSSESSSEGASGATVIAAIAGEPDQLDPNNTSAYFSFQVLENVFDNLVEPDENLEMQPALAESWELSDDQLTWTFHLREGVTWHDGTDFTAGDVAYTYNRIMDEELANAWRFSAVESVEAPDDSTVVITVTQPSPNLLSSIGGFKGLGIVQEANVTSGEIQTAPIGTGPFSVTEYVSGDHISLAANEDYWGGEPEVAGVEFRFISEPSTALAALQNGEIDWTDNIPPQQVADLEGDDALVLGVEPSNDYWYFALNQDVEPFDDVRVRQAIAYAVDREAIVQAVSYGTAKENQLAIPQTSAWYTAYDEYNYDLERAQELLDEAGVSDLEIDFMATSDYPESSTAAQVLASSLEDLGITVTIRTPDFATWLDEQGSGNWDALMLGWLGNIDPDDFYYAQHHSEGGSNFQGYSNPDVDALLDSGRVETDEAARAEIYAEAATMIADDASYIYLYNPAIIQAWSPDLEGYVARSDAAIRFHDVSLAD